MSFVFTRSTRLTADTDSTAVRQAMDILRRDQMNVLTGAGEENEIALVLDGALPAEGWRMEVTAQRVTVRHADDLGAVYGLLAISQRDLGLHPFFFWNDQVTPCRAQAVIPCGARESEPMAVRYRGWFINDEVLLDPWKKDEAAHREVWRMVFETLLRCGGNMVIPGTDRGEDGLDDLASSMGLILTQHHAELLGAPMFGRVWPQLRGSYRLHPDKFEQLWREAAKKYRGRRVIYAIGFRGQGDSAFWHEDPDFDTDEKRGREISRIMRRQMEIVREESPDALFCTNLYGEMMQLYRAGHLSVPEGVIKIWADNGFGRMLSRRQGRSNPRVDAMPRHEPGQNGIYYHASFYDLQAANHITQLQAPVQMVARELGEVMDNGASDYWIINAGSVKPHVYLLDLIREAWQRGGVDAQAHAAAYARETYGSESAARLLLEYGTCAAQYGPNEDDRAGEQYYAYAARSLAVHMMRGETEGAPDLMWAEEGTLARQAQGFARRCAPSVARWEAFLAACREEGKALAPEAAQLLGDTLVKDARIHLHGAAMMVRLGEMFACCGAEAWDEAFYRASEAITEADAALAALRGAEHGKWENYYGNDCFANLALTCDVLRTLRGWLRACHDGVMFYGWEREHLMTAAQRRIMLQTHKHCQYTDDELFARMKEKGVFART